MCALLCELVQKEQLERPEVRGQLERLRLHLSVRRSRRDTDLWAAVEAPAGQGGGPSWGQAVPLRGAWEDPAGGERTQMLGSRATSGSRKGVLGARPQLRTAPAKELSLVGHQEQPESWPYCTTAQAAEKSNYENVLMETSLAFKEIRMCSDSPAT